MFRRLDIENFRGIRKAEISDLSRINLFFGKNNCGKSSVLESIFLITGQSNPVLPMAMQPNIIQKLLYRRIMMKMAKSG
jgi:AAA15 family ATPase/GTPase